jgi:hypothetical protein
VSLSIPMSLKPFVGDCSVTSNVADGGAQRRQSVLYGAVVQSTVRVERWRSAEEGATAVNVGVAPTAKRAPQKSSAKRTAKKGTEVARR